MELPKNVTQIGEANPHCKIYVEDYVISYIKQLNRHAGDKQLAVALYGVRKEEAGIDYLFLYGACKLTFLQRECRHLSQAVLQEVEKQRKRYFSEYIFLGYRLLDGEMVEGFHICEQGVCRYVEGYAQFYEKNDSMLSFMLDERQGEIPPEEVDREKYDVVKKRQEERRASAENRGSQIVRYRHRDARKTAGTSKARLRNMQLTAAVSFVLLGAVGLGLMSNGEKAEEWRTAAGQLLASLNEKQLPDAVEVVNPSVQPGVIVAEDKLTEAIQKENAAAASGAAGEGQQGGTQPAGTEKDAQNSSGTGQSTEQGSAQQPTSTEEPAGQSTAEPAQEPTPNPTQEPTQEPTPEPVKPAEAETTQEPVSEPTSYTVQKGDTLIGICIRTYGSDARVAEICSLNHINNPDDIKEGAKILLP